MDQNTKTPKDEHATGMGGSYMRDAETGEVELLHRTETPEPQPEPQPEVDPEATAPGLSE